MAIKPKDFSLDVNVAALINAGLLKYVTYSDATYAYHCFAMPGSALADEAWMVKRVKSADSSITFSGGSWDFGYAATNLSTVQGHTYS